jgi:hypothetical protein
MKIFTLTAYSKESEDFEMQISAHQDLLFSDLHQGIQQALEYDPLQMASFFTCNEDWQKLDEIALIDMGEGNSSKLMDNCKLSDVLSEEGDKLLYLFDFFSERSFFMSITAINESKENTFTIDVNGGIPAQINIDSEGIDDLMSEFAEASPSSSNEFEDDEDVYGDDSISFENIDDLEDY